MLTEKFNGIEKHMTDCCALCQLSRVNNKTPKKVIQNILEKMSIEKKNNTEVGISTGKGQTAVFTIVSPGEDVLRKNLKSLGFKKVTTFERRVGYPEGMLDMYIKNL